MKYSRSQINKAGQIMLSSQDEYEVESAKAIINEWRQNHLPVLERLSEDLRRFLASNGVEYLFYSQRLKRMTSIQDKLDKSPEARLGGINDIGGLRFVFKDMDSLCSARGQLDNYVPEGFELIRKSDNYDYIARPRYTGYRSIHSVYKCRDVDERYDGLRIELQIRTKSQHNWATAVESAELLTNSALKNGEGTDVWLNFFKIVSALFSISEGNPVLEEYSGKTKPELVAELVALNKQCKCLALLKAVKASLQYVEKNEIHKDYYLLTVDYERKYVEVKGFTSDQKDEAYRQYSEKESQLDYSKNAVVLVSSLDIRELLEAYPSYFMNTTEFIDAVEGFLN